MKIGMICPYSFDIPGGVQAHVMELAQVFIDRGHTVSVLAPAGNEKKLPGYVVSVGEALAIPYNGSVARIAFGPRAYHKLRTWLREEQFDVLHVHEPNSPSVSMLSLMVAQGPIVTTFHTSTTKSLILSIFQGILRPYHERIAGKIAVSELARRWQMESLGSDAVEIPNGVHTAMFAEAEPLDGYPHPGRTVLFLGRFDEPRKGVDVLMKALPLVVARFPDVRIMIVGGGHQLTLRGKAGDLADHLVFLGQIDDDVKARALRSADVYCAPNLAGESFGIVLVEAMAAGAAVVASKLDAFRRVLDDGQAGVLVEIGDAEQLAAGIISVLSDDDGRAAMVRRARDRAARYDWSDVADQILRVYDTVVVGAGKVVVSD
jgi:phosphatidylinositol alpha-mannosyltransferase